MDAVLMLAVGVIAAKAARKQPRWTPDMCAIFARFSIGQNGDASTDEDDFQRHMMIFLDDRGV